MISRGIGSIMIAIVAAIPATASVTIDGIGGTFGSPDLTGSVLNPNGTTTSFDNSTTAEYAFEAGGQIIRWGNITPTPGFGTSALAFLGAATPGTVVDGQEFLLGTVFFGNGSSELDKLIFAAELTINISASAGGPVTPLTVDFNIGTTLNGFGAAWDADFVEITGLPSTTTLHAYEGSLVSANLYGKIVGDPMIEFTRLELQAGQENNGFIGNGALPPPVPEPSSVVAWTLLGLCAGGVEFARRRREARAA